jgi:Alpha/beta hydrolase domain
MNALSSFKISRIFWAIFALMACAVVQASDSLPIAAAAPGKPTMLIPLGSYDLSTLGYGLAEFFVSGTATSYQMLGTPSSDGQWTVTIDKTSPYISRILVAKPEPAKFNGTVVVEWMNVTGGTDTPVDWWTTHRELLRGGYAWVGVSAQSVGIEGGYAAISQGPMSPPSLKKVNPDRYGKLNHPGDAFSYDIYSQVGQLLHSSNAGGVLGSLAAKRIIAIGESQSAVYLTTYVNAIAPLAQAYDGYLIHSRFGISSRLDGAPMRGSSVVFPQNVRIRTDLRAPIIVVNTETDVIGGSLLGTHGARQPDTDRLRTWEIPGTSHADAYLVKVAGMDSGSVKPQVLAAALAPSTDFAGTKLSKPMNFNPAPHYVVEAALRSLDRWIAKQKAPPKAKPIQLSEAKSTGDVPTLAVDTHGNALGGIRTPWLDVPTALFSGKTEAGAPLQASLAGMGEPFDMAKLQQLYPGGKTEYLKKFEIALAATIKAGFILPDDRQEILDVAAAAYEDMLK